MLKGVFNMDENIQNTEITQKKKNIPLIIVSIIAVLLAIALAFFIGMSFGDKDNTDNIDNTEISKAVEKSDTEIYDEGYKAALKNTLDCIFLGVTENAEDILPEQAWIYYADCTGVELDDAVDTFVSIVGITAKELSVSYTVKSYEKFAGEDLEAFKEYVAKNNGGCIDVSDIGDTAYKAEIDLEVQYEDETIKNTMTVAIININGKWYVVGGDGWFVAFS